MLWKLLQYVIQNDTLYTDAYCQMAEAEQEKRHSSADAPYPVMPVIC